MHGRWVESLVKSGSRDGLAGLDGISNAGGLDHSLVAVGYLFVALLGRAENDGEEHLVETQAQTGA